MKDPYLKPVIFGGLLIAILSTIFSLGIFIWAAIGGYVTVRLANKITKEIISYLDGLLLGLLTGTVGGVCLDILTAFSFNDTSNKQLLIRTLEKSWPKDLKLLDIKEALPSIFLITYVLIIIISVFFSLIGAFIGITISKQKPKTTN